MIYVMIASEAVKRTEFKMECFHFQYRKTFLEKLWDHWKFLSFLATSTLVSFKLVSV